MATPQTWNGSAWVATTKAKFAYHNGTTWVEPSDVKYWNGSSWVTIFSGGSSGSVAFRASSSNTANSVNSLNVTVPASVQTGDLLVLTVAQTTNSTTLFNAISGWTKVGEQRAGGAAHTIGIFYRLAQNGDASSTVTTTSAATENYTAHIRAYSGVHQTTPLDATTVFAEQDPAATTASAPAITVSTANSMVVTVYSVPTTANTTLSAVNWTDPSSFSNELTTCSTSTNNNAALATYDKSITGTGSQGPFAATITQSRRWALATLAIRPA